MTGLLRSLDRLFQTIPPAFRPTACLPCSLGLPLQPVALSLQTTPGLLFPLDPLLFLLDPLLRFLEPLLRFLEEVLLSVDLLLLSFDPA